ncbi:DUF6726 family protein [Paraburkholderia hayleyella]|uniref:DUF6726 family protein n=1 Tax=Paraburkholderia hayleyella TaxID=2152889 RepID=UPI001290DFDB|nr:DUF6726 family protein [Paraburkholderia hayleyella]
MHIGNKIRFTIAVPVSVFSSWRRRLARAFSLAVGAGLLLATAGCGLMAAPCRVASAGLKIVPLVGHVAAAPTDVCADVVDP